MPDAENDAHTGDDTDAVDPWDAPGPLEPRVLPQGTQADLVTAALLTVGRCCAALEPPAASPWYGSVRDGLCRAHDTAGAMLRFGYGEGEDQVEPYQVGFARDDLALAVEDFAGGSVPRDETVGLLLDLARAVYDFVAEPGDTELFDAACALADRLGGEQERTLRSRDLAELAAAREAGRTPDTRAMSERDEEYAQRFAERIREGLRARGHRIGAVLTGLPVPACEEGLDLVREIVAAMASRFGISDEEAVLRVTHYFKDWDLTDDSDTGDLLYIGHQTPVEWAGSIYLGLDFHEVQPDADLSGHEPRPLPQ
ncbi:hypothetical protein [Streptomyces sp. SCL15-6]|jgi:hypothetical protein|uniref:hypothetical protein n=1 Tax=Streptomyces sp. SCL15-6 TaxID=2967222 RepID=UPI002965D5B6|nr:hypothetical protein [Streptomyces sp. SCL15-6]